MSYNISIFEIPFESLHIIKDLNETKKHDLNILLQENNQMKLYVPILDIQSGINIKQLILEKSKSHIQDKKYYDCMPVNGVEDKTNRNLPYNYLTYNKLYDIKYFIRDRKTIDITNNIYTHELNYVSCLLFPPAVDDFSHKGGELFFQDKYNDCLIHSLQFKSSQNKDKFMCVMFDERKLAYHFNPVLQGNQIFFYFRLRFNPFLYSILCDNKNKTINVEKMITDINTILLKQNENQFIDTITNENNNNHNSCKNALLYKDYDENDINLNFILKYIEKNKLNLIPFITYFDNSNNELFYCIGDYDDIEDINEILSNECQILKHLHKKYPNSFFKELTIILKNGILYDELNNIELIYNYNFGTYKEFNIYPKNNRYLSDYGKCISSEFDMYNNQITKMKMFFLVIPSYIVQ